MSCILINKEQVRKYTSIFAFVKVKCAKVGIKILFACQDFDTRRMPGKCKLADLQM